MQHSMQGECFEALMGHQKLALEKHIRERALQSARIASAKHQVLKRPASQVAVKKSKVVDPSLLATTMGRPVVLPGKSNEA